MLGCPDQESERLGLGLARSLALSKVQLGKSWPRVCLEFFCFENVVCAKFGFGSSNLP